MKAGHHINRRTHKRHHEAQGVRVYDMTAHAGHENIENIYVLNFADMAAVCFDTQEEIAAHARNFSSSDDVLNWCAVMIAHAPTAAPLLSEAATNGWRVAVTSLAGGGYHLDAQARLLTIDDQGMSPEGLGRTPYFRNDFLANMIRGLRDIWHEARLARADTKYRPEDVLLLERTRIADTHCCVIQAGWELRSAGFADFWRHLLGSEEGDMAIMFSRYLERDPAAFLDGSALAHGFRQWFADFDRVNACDHQTLETLDGILSAGDYSRDALGKEVLSFRHLECVSLLPDGMVYLAGLGRAIASDPFFAGMNDAVNQAHFYQIMHDVEATLVNDVPFRDARLARLIFPEGETVRS